MDFGADSLHALANLLNPPQRNDDIDDEDDDIKMPRAAATANKAMYSTPSDVMAPSKPLTKDEKRDLKRQERTKNSNSKDIWEPEEVLPTSEYDDVYDGRPQPDYTIAYRQTVTTDDVYLGMTNKNPSTASCETMVIRIQLPDAASVNEIELNVKKSFLDCRTKTYRLGLHLPFAVDDKSAKAEWNSTKRELCISLRMVREYDDFNF